MVERSAMNREVPGSNPGRGFSSRVKFFFSFDYVFHTSKLDFNGERVALNYSTIRSAIGTYYIQEVTLSGIIHRQIPGS